MTVSDLTQAFETSTPLATHPNVAHRLLRASGDLEALGQAIRHDVALVIKLMRMVNTATYGLASEVGSIPQAIDVLGLRSVQMLALSFTLDQNPEADFASFSERSVRIAAAAKQLGPAFGVCAETAYLTGLLSDFGWFALGHVAPDQVREIQRVQNGRPMPEVQREVLGWDASALGAAMLRRWELPAVICDAIESQHEASDRPLDLILRASIALVDDGSFDAMGAEAGRFSGMLAEVQGAVAAAIATFAVDGEVPQPGQLQADAAVQLAMLSMQSEAELFQLNRNEERALQESERLNQENKRILVAASTDGLTQIANRAAFDKRLDEDLARAGEHPQRLALLLMDVDFFKKFNDTYGHRAGDEVLRSVAQVLSSTAPGFVARYGGEEFAVIVADPQFDGVAAIGEELRAAIEAMDVAWEGETLKVTASFGAAVVESGFVPSSKDLIEQADQQLYAAKRAGRNCVRMVTLSNTGTAIPAGEAS